MGDKDKPFELSAFQSMCLYGWPGNVRELGKAVISAEALARGAERIGFDHLPTAIAAVPRLRSSPGRRKYRKPPSAEELETLMKRFQGNMMRVARELDRKPALVYRWARRFGLPVAEFRPKEDGGAAAAAARKRATTRKKTEPLGGACWLRSDMWGRSHTQIHGYETETMKIEFGDKAPTSLRCGARAIRDHRTAEVRRSVNAWMT